MKAGKRNAALILTCSLAMSAAGFIGGCEVRAHGHFDEVDIVDDHGWHHHGYYDDNHAWHGGYYDDGHVYHDDDPAWHR
jgi:hypothetical protein